jgi:integrase
VGFEPTTSDLGGTKYTNLNKLLLDFEEFCRVDLQLSRLTVRTYRAQIKRFLETVRVPLKLISRADIRSYLSGCRDKRPETYANVLKSLRVFFRDFLQSPSLVETFRFPKKAYEYQPIPSKEDLRRFYNGLKSIEAKLYFLLYATTGLRTNELLSIEPKDVDLDNRMIVPPTHQGRTKRTWVTFYNEEAESLLREYLPFHRNRHWRSRRLIPISKRRLRMMWREGFDESGIRVTPTILRKWFCSEMGRLGVPDRYIDAFCGRTPKSVLAKHYSDYSPRTLKEIYDKAKLKVLT